MREKIIKTFVSILILVFFIGNVSFTTVLHYCEMMKKASKSECGMCEVEDEFSSVDDYSLLINDFDNQACCKNSIKSTD
ncbi:MAG: hypothetical protein ACPL25_01775 [Ignavibacteria bacterium]